MIGSILRIRYELTEAVSDGPIFSLFRAKDRVQGREVSVRLLKPPFDHESEFVDAIRNVAAHYSKVGSSGVENLSEVDDHDGQPFVVGEAISGQPLQERIDKLAPFSVSVAVSTTISICEALSSLHQSGIAHGDLSARNILSQADGQCRLQLAGMWEALSASQTAGMIALPGMAPYLAPEVSAGSMPSPSSDVYSAGVLLYQLLSGRFPFSADTPVAMAMKHATAAVPSVKIFNSAVPVALDEIVKRAMAKDPAIRYPSASELLSDLRILQDGLRFGKPLTSPIKHPTVVTEKQPVAPKMSAIREPERKDKQKKDKAPRDVPLWLLIIFGLCAVVFLSLIGMWVVFNVSQPKLVVVPNIKGSKMSEAGKTLEGLKLKLRVFGRETNEMQPPDTILSMSPPAGRKLHEGSTVSVKISTGSRLVTVPDLTGATVDKAQAMLEALNLSLTESYSSQPDSKLDAGLIISQSPAAKAKVDRFGRVSIVVSSGKTGGAPINSEQDKQYLYNLKIKLSGLTESVVLRVEIVDARGERTIYESPHEPEDNVEIPAQGYGKVATFKIYYDNQLVTTKEKKAEDEAPQPN